jgi:hypothetical protein
MIRTCRALVACVPLFAALTVLLLFAGCKKEEAPVVVAASLHAPASQTDDAGWKAYLQDVIGHNNDGVTDRTNAYYLPAPGAAEYDGKYTRQLQGVQDVAARGVLPGNMLAFMSPDSSKMADLVVAAFKDASAGSMKGVVVLFVGKSADNERVKAVITPTGAIYRFVEAK